MRIAALILTLQLTCLPAVAGQDVSIRGTVTSSQTGEAIRFVTVTELTSSRRVMTDKSGSFVMSIKSASEDSAGTSRLVLVFSCMGFERDTIVLRRADTTISVTLNERPVSGREVVVTAEDPAVAIMRRVLERRRIQRETLRTYAYTLYTKFIAMTDTATALRSSGRGDTTVNSILESFSPVTFNSRIGSITRSFKNVRLPTFLRRQTLFHSGRISTSLMTS